MNHDKGREIAIWRMSILGTLVSARLEHGDRKALLAAAAAPSYEAPDPPLVGGCPAAGG